MAKRFVDTSKWDREWFRKLPVKMKCAWDYLTCRCDHAGVWQIDMDRMAFEIGTKITLKELKESFSVVVVDGDKLFIPGFIPFQYNCEISELKETNNAHKSVLTIIKKIRTKPAPAQPLGSPCGGGPGYG